MSTSSFYHLTFRPSVTVPQRPLQIIRVAPVTAGPGAPADAEGIVPAGAPPILDHAVDIPRRAVRVIHNGGLVAYPTDTVYGLGCDIYNVPAVRRVYEVKQRPFNEALPVLIADPDDAGELAGEIPPLARRLIARFWPGALTIVLPKGRRVPQVVAGGGETVALRVPDHPVPRALIEGAGVPIIGTSANIHGGLPPSTAQQVIFALGDRVDIVLDGGRTPLARESTVVDATQDPPRVLREGAISRSRVEEALGFISARTAGPAAAR